MAKKPVGVTKVEDAEGKQKALDAVLGLINKNYGAGAVQKLGEATGLDVESISLGAPSLDMALGIGGIPAGRVVEIYGPESSGKTTVALQAVASVQKAGGTAAFIDAEHALDPVYAANLGVDIDSLLVSQPDTGEQALEIMDMLVGSGAVDIVVVDSVAALVPRAEIEGDMGDSHVGLQARMMSQALRKITGRLSSTGTTAIFINQLREKIGVFFGNPETTTGGKALKFYASVRIDIRRVTTIKDKAGNSIGNRTRAKIVKNKVAPPFKMAEFEITYGKGVDTTGNILSMAIEQDIVKQSGAWYSYPPGNREKETPNKMFLQGEEACKKWFKDPANYEAVLEIGNKVAATYMPDRKYVAYAAEFNDPVIDYDPETYHDPNAVGGLVDTETGEVDDDFLSGLE